jgi:hypothetical protein
MECGTRSCRFRASRGLRAPTSLRKAVAALVPRCATALQMGGVCGFGTLMSRRGRRRVRYGVRHAKLPLSSVSWFACANRPAESGSCARASLRDRTPKRGVTAPPSAQTPGKTSAPRTRCSGSRRSLNRRAGELPRWRRPAGELPEWQSAFLFYHRVQSEVHRVSPSSDSFLCASLCFSVPSVPSVVDQWENLRDAQSHRTTFGTNAG